MRQPDERDTAVMSATAGERSLRVQVKLCPLLLVLSGPSGVGKTTVTKALQNQGWSGHVLITATTRRPRESEIPGVDYHFLTVEEFHRMAEAGAFLEYAEVHGNRYGTPAAPVREKLAAGVEVIIKIDPQGAKAIRARARDAGFVFLAPEALDELVAPVNLRGPGSPGESAIRPLHDER